MQSKNKTRIENIEESANYAEKNGIAIKWVDYDKITIEYQGESYKEEEFKSIHPDVKIVEVSYID